MKKYYLHKDNEQHGPFTVEELKEQKISRTTLIWFEGMENWTKAEDISDLATLFKSTPPPVMESSKVVPPPVNKTPKESPANSIPQPVNNRKRTILIAISILVVISAIGGLYYANQKQKQVAMENKLKEQEAIVAADKARNDSIAMAEATLQQEHAQQMADELKGQELADLKNQYDEAVTSLRSAKIQLGEIQKFQLLRTSEEKEEQIRNQLETIQYYENQISLLEKKMNE